MKKLLGTLALMGMASQAQAGLLNVNISGVITSMPELSSYSESVDSSLPPPAPGALFSVGDSFNISLSYHNASTPESNCSRMYISTPLHYECRHSISHGTLTIGDRTFDINKEKKPWKPTSYHRVSAYPGTQNVPTALVGDATMKDTAQVKGPKVNFVFHDRNPPNYILDGQYQSATLNGEDISSPEVLWKTIDLSKYALSGLWVGTLVPLDETEEAYQSHQYNLTPYVTSASLSEAPVPLPAAAWLFLSGLVGLVGISRKAKKSA